MDVFALVEKRIAVALEALKSNGDLPDDLDLAGIEVQEPRDASHGDVASNAAMVLAKRAKRKPREIAEAIAHCLEDVSEFEGVEVAGPGFLNVRLSSAVWEDVLRHILNVREQFGQLELGAGQRVHLEYVSANPTGPMHIGHCRGAVYGDALANVLAKAGYDVTREYYINDGGNQVDKLAETAYLRYREALGEPIGEIPEGLYPGDYMKAVGRGLAEAHGDSLLEKAPSQYTPIVREFAIKLLMAAIREDLEQLGVTHDVFFSERSLTEGKTDQVAMAIAVLRERGLIFEGRLPRPKGHDDDDWEDREQTLFRSTQFGDDVDRALMKSDGTYTYFANDVAYHYAKWRGNYDAYLNVLGADHVGYIPRLKAAAQALSNGDMKLETPVTQLVKVLRDGEPVRMSKRAGTFVALRDVVDEVGRDPVRFMMLMRKHDSAIDFDLAKVVEQSKDNPVFYVQYAHARATSIFKTAQDAHPELDLGPENLKNADLSLLSDAGERNLVKLMSRFPRVLASAAREREPHRVPFYLYDLASTFHQQYARGNDSPQLRFSVKDDGILTASRLALVLCVQSVISSGLTVLGVHAPDEMR